MEDNKIIKSNQLTEIKLGLRKLETFEIGDIVKQNGVTYWVRDFNKEKRSVLVQSCKAGFMCTFSYDAEFVLVPEVL